jgi:hypothetical protein
MRTLEPKCKCGWGPFKIDLDGAPWSAVRLALWWQCPVCGQVWSTPINPLDGPPVLEPKAVGQKVLVG